MKKTLLAATVLMALVSCEDKKQDSKWQLTILPHRQ